MTDTRDKLNWLAFRYVANELNESEANEFESRLMTDQAAREAVAGAVEQTTQIRQALTDVGVYTAASQRLNWGRQKTRFAVVMLGSCLTLLLAICLVRSSLPPEDGIAIHSAVNEPSDSSAQLAYAWVEARYGLDEFQAGSSTLLADSSDVVLIASSDSDFEQAFAAPSWMLAALAKMDDGIDSDVEIQE